MFAYAVQRYPEAPVEAVDRVRMRREYPLEPPVLYHNGINRRQEQAPAGRFIDFLA